MVADQNSADVTEVLARFSRIKCIGYSAVVISVILWYLWYPFASGKFVLPQGSYGALWPVGAVLAVPCAIMVAWNLIWALAGGPVIRLRGDRFTLYLPWVTSIEISQIACVESTAYKADPKDLGLVSRYSIIPTTSYIPQVSISLKDGTVKNVRTPLLQQTAAGIAERMSVLVRARAGVSSR
jgi:hypothetical protein